MRRRQRQQRRRLQLGLRRSRRAPRSKPNNTTAQATSNPVQITGDTTITGAIAPIADLDTYRLVVATATVIRFETFSSLYDCVPAATTIDLRLFDSAGATILADMAGQGIGQCGEIAFFLAAGTYFIRVEERGNNAAIAAYTLQVDYQTNRGAESEVRDQTGPERRHRGVGPRASWAPTTRTCSVTTSTPRTPTSTPSRCRAARASARRSSRVTGPRRRASPTASTACSRCSTRPGGLIAEDDDDGRGFCSLLDGSGTTPLDAGARNTSTTAQQYYIMVRRSSLAAGTQQNFIYRLVVTFR